MRAGCELVERCPRRWNLDSSVEDIPNQVVDARDRGEIDGCRCDAQRVRALLRQRPERDLDQRRRRRDLRGQLERARQYADTLLEISGRIASTMRDAREAKKKIDRSVSALRP